MKELEKWNSMKWICRALCELLNKNNPTVLSLVLGRRAFAVVDANKWVYMCFVLLMLAKDENRRAAICIHFTLHNNQINERRQVHFNAHERSLMQSSLTPIKQRAHPSQFQWNQLRVEFSVSVAFSLLTPSLAAILVLLVMRNLQMCTWLFYLQISFMCCNVQMC